MRKMCRLLCCALLCTVGIFSFTACTDKGNNVKEITVPEGAKVIKVSDYRKKVENAYIGQLVGVSYGIPAEFKSKRFLADRDLPTWRKSMILEGYNQDDVYLSVTAVEALEKFGLDVGSRQIAVEMYNKDFEFWVGSNNNVLKRYYAPPFAGYPFSNNAATSLYPDGNSYQCGISFAGLLSPFMPAYSNELCQKFAESVCYGDGIYGAQFVAAMYSEAFFESDVKKVIAAGLRAIPQDSWTVLAVTDTLNWFDEGKSAQQTHELLMEKYWYGTEYNWIEWPYGGRTGGINLDAKMCAAFIVHGLLYGNGDFESSVKNSIKCANDADSTAATTAGILAMIGGFDAVPSKYTEGLKPESKFKYSSYRMSDLVNACEKLAKEIVMKQGGLVGFYQGGECMVIPPAATTVTPGTYQNSKNPEPMETMYFTEQEKDGMRVLSDPGFERHNESAIANGWRSSTPDRASVETYQDGEAHTGLANGLIKASAGWQDLFTTADVQPNVTYEFSCWVRAGAGVPANAIKLFAKSEDGSLLIREVAYSGSGEWRRITLTFNSTKQNIVRIGVGFTGGASSDWVRVDDVELWKK